MTKELRIGISGGCVLHTDKDQFDVDTRFRMAAEAGVFDYFDRTPARQDLDSHLRASRKYALPFLASGWFYMVGRDEQALVDNLELARECGASVHNVQVMTKHADGHILSDDEVADIYLWAAEQGTHKGVSICFENHINMWSEHFGRVNRVADLVHACGGKFHMTLDHSHVIFKIDNPKEQLVQNMKADIDLGLLELDPRRPGNVAKQWIDSNFVLLAHARAAIPNGPANIWARHPDGSLGRGVQYPFVKPEPGDFHSEWDELRLEPWKQTVRDLLTHHLTCDDSNLVGITTEMSAPPDYGGGAKYSIFANNIAIARFIREMWREITGAAVA